MKMQLLVLLSSITLLFCSCNRHYERTQHMESKAVEEAEEAVTTDSINIGLNIDLTGQWKTAGHESIVPNWLEFDPANDEFYGWHVSESRPATSTGKYQVNSDSLLVFSYAEYSSKVYYSIDSVTENYLEITSIDVNHGKLIYEKTFFEEAEFSKNESDTTIIAGTLLAIEESDFWGKIYLILDVEGKRRVFTYFTFDVETKYELEKLITKKVSIAYYTEVTTEEADLHVKGTSIHGEYARVVTDEDKKWYSSKTIEGVITVTEYDISGDLPSSYKVTKQDGSEIDIHAFVHSGYLQHNGKEVIVYSYENHKELVSSVIPFDEETPNKDSLVIGGQGNKML